MTKASNYTLTLDLSVQDPDAVLHAAAMHLTRTGLIASAGTASVHLAGDVPKALTVLIGLHNLSWPGVTALRIDCKASADDADGSALSLAADSA